MPLPDVTIGRTGPAPGFRVAPERGLARSVCGFIFAFALLFAAFFGVPDLLAYFEAPSAVACTDFLVEMPAAMLDEPRAAGGFTKAAYAKP
jgi:hypothetical protein